MNMSKKIFIYITLFILLLSYTPKVNAVTYQSLEDDIKVCKLYTNREDCTNYNCTWNGTECMNSNVAENPCDENDIRRVLKIFGNILLIIRVAVPLVIIGFGTIDLFKSVIDKDEKSFGKQIKQIMIRVVAGIIIFFVPNFINAIFGLSNVLNIMEDDQFLTCSECVLEPTKDFRCVLEED